MFSLIGLTVCLLVVAIRRSWVACKRQRGWNDNEC